MDFGGGFNNGGMPNLGTGDLFNGGINGLGGALNGLGPMGSGTAGIGGSLGGSLASGLGGALSKLDPSQIGKNRFTPDMPQSNFAATTPGIQNTNFASGIDNRMSFNPDFQDANQLMAQQRDFAAALQNRGNAAYGQQQGLIGQLQQDAAGNGPGSQLARQMTQQAAQNNIAQMSGAIASQRGINPALAARLIGQQAAGANQAAAQQGSNMALQSQLAARSQLGGLTSGELGLTTQGIGNTLNTSRGQTIDQTLGGGQLNNATLGTLVAGQGAQNAAINNGNLGAQDINSRIALGNLNAGVAGQQIQGNVASSNAATQGGIIGGILNAGGKIGAAAMAHGGVVDGKAKVDGDSPHNDTVNAKLSPGEIVVPRTAADDPDKAHRFIDHIMAKKGKSSGYGGVLSAKREIAALKNKLAELEKKIGSAA